MGFFKKLVKGATKALNPKNVFNPKNLVKSALTPHKLGDEIVKGAFAKDPQAGVDYSGYGLPAEMLAPRPAFGGLGDVAQFYQRLGIQPGQGLSGVANKYKSLADVWKLAQQQPAPVMAAPNTQTLAPAPTGGVRMDRDPGMEQRRMNLQDLYQRYTQRYTQR